MTPMLLAGPNRQTARLAAPAPQHISRAPSGGRSLETEPINSRAAASRHLAASLYDNDAEDGSDASDQRESFGAEHNSKALPSGTERHMSCCQAAVA